MPEQTFGGDDEGRGGTEPKKKISLSKFGLSPDVNIRDVFWKIMASYAATKKPGTGLSTLENDRFALMRAALSVLSSPHGEQYGLAPRFIATYTLMMLLDGGWKDALAEFLERGLEDSETAEVIASSLERLASNEEHREALGGQFTAMIRGSSSNAVAVAYLALMKDAGFAGRMKKELMIIARGDIGRNQMNAIGIISRIKDDADVKKTLVALLFHWDSDARLAAAEALAPMAGDQEVKAAAKRRLAEEIEPEIKRALERITK